MARVRPIVVAETAAFRRSIAKALSEGELDALIGYLGVNPTAGTLIPGTGGVRRLRWAVGNAGKSGGARVIYYYHDDEMPLYLLACFRKSDRIDVTQAETNEMKALTRTLVDSCRRRGGAGRSGS